MTGHSCGFGVLTDGPAMPRSPDWCCSCFAPSDRNCCSPSCACSHLPAMVFQPHAHRNGRHCPMAGRRMTGVSFSSFHRGVASSFLWALLEQMRPEKTVEQFRRTTGERVSLAAVGLTWRAPLKPRRIRQIGRWTPLGAAGVNRRRWSKWPGLGLTAWGQRCQQGSNDDVQKSLKA